VHLLTEFTSKRREVTRFRVQSHRMVQGVEWGVFTAGAHTPRLPLLTAGALACPTCQRSYQ